MKNIIEEMYNGTLYPLNEHRQQATEHEKLVQKQLKAEKEFLKQYPECREALEKLLSECAELESYTAYEEFQCGFRMGSQMMLEMLHPMNNQADECQSSFMLGWLFLIGIDLLPKLCQFKKFRNGI